MKNDVEKSFLKLSILLPVRNEGINIELMLKILEAVLDVPHEILIIYDSPKDDTIPIIRKIRKRFTNIKTVHNRYGKGAVNAVKAGVEKSKGKYILILAVDDVGPTLAIDDMVNLMDKGCDLVSCTRYKFGGRRLGGSFIEAIISMTGNWFFNLLCGSAFSDSTTGFKMFRKNLFSIITLESKPIGWAFVFEIAVKAQVIGLKLGEVPIISIDRLYGGKSSFIFSPWLREYLRWFLYGALHFQALMHNRKVLVRIPKTTTS